MDHAADRTSVPARSDDIGSRNRTRTHRRPTKPFIRLLQDNPGRCRDTELLDRAPHDQGYWEAQAAGFRVLRTLDRYVAMLDEIPRSYAVAGLPEELFGSSRWEQTSDELQASAIDEGALHALRIARAQERNDRNVQLLEAAVEAIRFRHTQTVLFERAVRDARSANDDWGIPD